ncbi:MAG: glycine oxidase ThiO [Niveispirillum sp.]|uniref:glycine oxidase ThiO n=1 Tax=Niveispirillum sp. TaxID=1917217 RepID=UPI00403524F1
MSLLHRPDRPRVAIIGGGIIGMAIGWRLAQGGASVDIFDRASAGQGATRAAAGMLAAGVEAEPGEQRLLPLCLESQARWPGFAAELEALTGMQVGLRTEGTLVVASTRDEVELLRSNYEFQRGLGLDLVWLSGAAAKEKEPFLNPRTAAGVFSAKDGQVDNRLAAAALRVALERTGARLHEGVDVTGLDVQGGRATGVVLGDRVVPADSVVLAAGAWSRLVPGQASPPPVRPVKGQMMSLVMDPANPLLSHVVWAPKCYLVPRADGTLIIGATTEEKGFDAQMTAGGVLALLDAAWRALPGVEELPVKEMWVGHRPGCRDDAPILGPAAGLEGLVLATGHHRNGILLAPLTADAIADLVLTGRVDPHIAPFGAGRFDAARAA